MERVILLLTVQARVLFLLTEDNIFLEINQSETRTACGGHEW
jgi:hypothetical protein